MLRYIILSAFILFCGTAAFSQVDVLKQLQRMEKERREQELSLLDSNARSPLSDSLAKVNYVPTIDAQALMTEVKGDLNKADALFAKKKYDDAVKLYEGAYNKMYEHRIDIEYTLGASSYKADSLGWPISQCYFKLNDLDRSLDALNDYLSYIADANKTASVEVVQHRAELSYKMQKFQDATYAYTSLLTDYKVSDSMRFYAHFYRGISYYNLDYMDYAKEDFKTCSSLQPKRFEPYYNLGRCSFKTLVTKEQLKQAIDYFTKSLSINPIHIPSLFLRARSYERIEKYKLALDDYIRCTQLDPTYADAFYKKAFMHFRLNKNKVRKSICEEFQEAIRLGSGDALNFSNEYCKKKK